MRALLLVAVPKSYLHQWQHCVIALLGTLKRQQVIIRATGAGRELATHGRPAIVNCAAALHRIEKLTSLAENRVGLSS